MGANDIRFSAILVESKQDRYGTWVVRLEVPQADKAALMALSDHTEKNLDVSITPPSSEGVFGKVQES